MTALAPARKKSKVVWIGLGLVLVLLLLVALLPTLLGSFVAGRVESAFSERFEGRLEVASLQLAWSERQQVSAARLLDPDGGEVARLSAEFPSILDLVRSEGLRLGLFTAKVDARLVADDAGITNLQRALMPRPGASGGSSAGAQAEDGAQPLDPSQLEFEFVLQAPLVAWSDAATRAAGADFEIRDLWVRARAERGKALDLELRGTVGGSGALQGRAQIEGISTNPGRPFTRATANLDVRGLSCGLVDGLARMNGDLPTLLGPALDLSLALDASGLENGSVRLGLGSERAQVQFAAGLSDGVLRLEGERGAEISLNIPFARIERALSAQLPPGFSLQSPQENLRIALRIPRLETRLDLPAQSTAAQWARFARELQAQFQLSIASPLSFQTPELAKANLRPLMRDLLLRGTIAPGQPLQLGASTLLDTGVPGTLKLSVASADLLDALAGGEEPHVDVRLEVTDISNAFLDALIGQEDLLASGAGQALDIDLIADGATTSSADFKLELRSARLDLKASGRWTPERLTASGDDGLDLLFSPETSWWTRFGAFELAGYTPEVLSGRLRAKLRSLDVPLDFSDLRKVEEQLSAALQLELPVLALRRGDAAIGLRSPKLNVSVARGGTVGFRLDSQLSANWVSRLELLGELQGWSGIAEGRIPKWSADFNLDELDVAALESLSGAELGLLQRLGERADLRVRAEELDESGGKLALDLQAPKWKLNLQAAGANRRFNTTARLEGLLAQEDLDVELARFAPAGLKLMREDDLPLVIELSESSVTLPARERMGDAQAWLEALAARVQLTVPSMGIRQPALDPSGVQLRHEGLKAQIAIANHSMDADLRVDLEDVTGKYAALAGSRLAVHAKLAGWLDSQELQLELQSERGQLAAHVRHADGRIELLAQDGLTLKWKPDAQHATSELRSLLPAMVQLEALDPANFELLLRARGGSLTLPRDAAGMQLGAGLQLDAELPPLALRLGGAQSPALVLKETKLSADEQGRARLGTRLQPDGSGSLVVEITPGAGLDAVLRDLGPMAITLKGTGVPLAAIDALIEPAGMLTEMLGSSVDLQLESPAWTPASAEIKGWIRSPQFAVEVQALAGTDGVRITQPSGLAASFGLGPLSSENFLGGVLPMVCAVTKPAEAKPARLVVNQLNFPLGADLSKLDADLTLELGEIQYAWLPGLSEAFGSAATVEKTRLGAFPIRIQQGVVRYDKLPLKLGGKEVMFSGSYQLTDQKIALNFSVPLEILGRKVSKELEKARDFIDPKLAVPLEIRGTPAAPKLSIGKGFLESVVKQALERQLQKGLESLFSDDEEKPKKP